MNIPKLEQEKLKYYSGFTNEEILKQIENASGERKEEALIVIFKRFTGVIKKLVSTYYIKGAEHEDLEQEGYVGLYNAIKNYESEKSASFSYFATICIKRRIYTSMTKANRNKHEILNNSTSYDQKINKNEANSRTFKSIIENSNLKPPEEKIILNEKIEKRLEKLEDSLSKLEYDCFKMYCNGISYNIIAEKLEISYSSVKNAIYRAQEKIRNMNEDKKKLV